MSEVLIALIMFCNATTGGLDTKSCAEKAVICINKNAPIKSSYNHILKECLK